MKHITYIFFLLISTLTFGQDRESHINIYDTGDTCLWYKWNMDTYDQINLESIKSTKHNWQFRFATNIQAIDIWEDLEGKTGGKLTNWTSECDENGELPNKSYYSENIDLSASQVNSLIALIDSSQINNIPDQFLIEEWVQGFDGLTYFIESANDQKYYFKSYWTPKAQDSLKEAMIVQDFATKVLKLVDANTKWEDFEKRVPFECYKWGGILMKCKSWGTKK